MELAQIKKNEKKYWIKSLSVCLSLSFFKRINSRISAINLSRALRIKSGNASLETWSLKPKEKWLKSYFTILEQNTRRLLYTEERELFSHSCAHFQILKLIYHKTKPFAVVQTVPWTFHWSTFSLNKWNCKILKFHAASRMHLSTFYLPKIIAIVLS